MGIISVEQADNLYWLGRYTERVYTTIRLYFQSFDTMIDELSESYPEYCRMVDIPNIYSDKEDFMKRYPFDSDNPDSIISTLNRVYDNAIVLRDSIGSEGLSYIQHKEMLGKDNAKVIADNILYSFVKPGGAKTPEGGYITLIYENLISEKDFTITFTSKELADGLEGFYLLEKTEEEK